MKRNIWVLAGAALLSLGLSVNAGLAQTCGGVYTVQPGDSLSVIADSLYKDAKKWTAIHQSNLDQIGPSADSLYVGMKLNLLCLNGLPLGLEGGTDISAAAAPATGPVISEGTGVRIERINLVTGDDYAPFTDRKLDKGGMLTELVQRAMEEANPAEGFAIHWVNDWSSHLDTLAAQGLVDGTFPWAKPKCDLTPDEFRCQNFLFSDPMFEILDLVYVAKDSSVKFDVDADLEGKTICRVAGYSTWSLDQDGRNWLVDGKIQIKRPERVGDCFSMLVAGEVDAVVIDEFSGRASIKELGLSDKVLPLTRPISVEPLNLLVHKGNPRAAEIVETINTGLRKLKATGEYQEIIGRHLSAFWAES